MTGESHSNVAGRDGAESMAHANGANPAEKHATPPMYRAPSHERFAWLISPFAPIPGERPSAEEANQACAFMIECWQQLPTALPRFETWMGKGGPRPPLLKRARARETAVRTYARLQNLLLERIIDGVDRRRIPYVLLKSSALRWYVYDSPLTRCGMDIDIGVGSNDLQEMQQVLYDLGFVQAQWNQAERRFEGADPLLRALVEMVHYELGFLVRRQRVTGLGAETERMIHSQLDLSPNPWHLDESGELACYVVVDVHHGISREVSVDTLLESYRRIATSAAERAVPSDAWTLFHLIFKIYWEGVHDYENGFYQYGDLCRLIERVTADDVLQLRALLSQYNMNAGAYYVLRRIPSDLGTPLPPELNSLMMENAVPPEGRRPGEENDLGDMWPKLWGRR
ncbi:MAG: nucleotidyltransferase family protein [Bacteroidetes bacterium]|nr:nucleotidyltransferase family protein [Bacteroidota bacterium]